MKNLFEYILENREYFNPEFGIEEIKVLFTGMAENEEFDEEILSRICPFNMNIDTADAILTAYFYSKSGMNGKVTNETCRKFIDMIKKQPVDRIKRILGAGGEGMVYDLGNDRVLKIIFDTDFVSNGAQNLKIYKSMIGKNFVTLPKIYKVTQHFIIRESVTPATTKCANYYRIATTNYPGLKDVGGTMERGFARGKIYDVNVGVPKSNNIQEVRKWLLTLRNELNSIGINIKVNYGDFRLKNIGETKDGRVVYFDW